MFHLDTHIWTKTYSGNVEQPCLVDLDGDGIQEILAYDGAEKHIIAYAGDGTEIWRYGGSLVFTNPVVKMDYFDITGDGYGEIVCQERGGDILYLLTPTLTPTLIAAYQLPSTGYINVGFNFHIDGPTRHYFVYGDITGDSIPELLIQEQIDGTHYVTVVSTRPPLPPVDDTETYIEYVDETLQSLPVEYFAVPDEDVPDTQADFTVLFEDALENIAEENYLGAIDKLTRIKEDITDSIDDAGVQQALRAQIDSLIAYLQTLN